MAGEGIDQAGTELAREDVVEAGLVAGDAGVDRVGAAGGGLVHELGIGEEGPRHRHHVGIAAGQHVFGDLRVVDAVGGDQRDPTWPFMRAVTQV
jgi:hypothetical protein